MQVLDLPAVDVAMLIVLAVSAGVGVWRGFVYEAASLLGWVVAYVGAQRFAPWLTAEWALQGYSPELGRGSAFLLLFIVILLGGPWRRVCCAAWCMPRHCRCPTVWVARLSAWCGVC